MVFLGRKFIFAALFITISAILLYLTVTFFSFMLIYDIVSYIRLTGWLINYQYQVVIGVFLLGICFVLMISKWLTIWLANSNNNRLIIRFYIIILIFAAYATYTWYAYTHSTLDQTIDSTNKQFQGGPYPDKSKLAQLKKDGFKGIITLLDPVAFPLEPILISKENNIANDENIIMYHFPTLPGSPLNPDAIKLIQSIINSRDNNKYYIHAYYGKDRVTGLINYINKITSVKPNQNRISIRYDELKQTTQLERGNILVIDDKLIAAPMPTDDEFKQYIINTPNNLIKVSVKNVVSINSATPNNNENISSLLSQHNIKFFTMPIKQYPYDPVAVLDIAKKIKSMQEPVLVYSYYMPPLSTVMSGFLISYLTNLPAIPQGIFDHVYMTNGSIKMIAPNIAIGVEPLSSEFKDVLAPNGIRTIAYLGPCESSQANLTMKAATNAKLEWHCFDKNIDDLYLALNSMGPWYIYGPNIDNIKYKLLDLYSKSIPNIVLGGTLK